MHWFGPLCQALSHFVSRSYRSSLLFQACLSMTLSNQQVVYICQKQFDELPYFVHNMPKPTSELLKLINFKSVSQCRDWPRFGAWCLVCVCCRYLSDGEELISFISALHTEAKLPSLIAIENLPSYVCSIKYEQVRSF